MLDLYGSCGFLECYCRCHIAAAFPGNGSGDHELIVLSYGTHPTHSSQILQLPWSQIWNPNLYSKVFVYWSTHEHRRSNIWSELKRAKPTDINFHNQSWFLGKKVYWGRFYHMKINLKIGEGCGRGADSCPIVIIEWFGFASITEGNYIFVCLFVCSFISTLGIFVLFLWQLRNY